HTRSTRDWSSDVCSSDLVMGAGIDAYNSYAQRGSFQVIEHQIAAALELFPIFSRVHVLRTWAGLVDVAPDASPIIGRTPVENLLDRKSTRLNSSHEWIAY